MIVEAAALVLLVIIGSAFLLVSTWIFSDLLSDMYLANHRSSRWYLFPSLLCGMVSVWGLVVVILEVLNDASIIWTGTHLALLTIPLVLSATFEKLSFPNDKAPPRAK